MIEALNGASRPAIIAGRGAVLSGAGPALRALGERLGAVLATTAVANGLFAGDPFDLGISGGFSTPLAQQELKTSDVVIAFGAALNVWTTRHGALIGSDATLIQVDRDLEAIGAHRPVDLGVVGDARAVADRAARPRDRLGPSPRAARGRSPRPLARRALRGEPQRARPAHAEHRPRRAAAARERTVVVDSGAFMGYPAMYLRVPDAQGFVFPQAFQCVGLALGNAIGAAVANPDRLTVCAVGDGGLLMSLPDLETLGRLQAQRARRGLRRRRLRRRGASLPADGHPRRARAVPARRTSPRSPRPRAAKA